MSFCFELLIFILGIVLFSTYDALSQRLPSTLENQFIAGGVAGKNFYLVFRFFIINFVYTIYRQGYR